MTPRGRLLRKYVVFFALLVCGALLASGAVEIYFSYQESKQALSALQREKAQGAAARIEEFVRSVERQIGWATHRQLVTGPAALEQRRIDFYRLMLQVPAVMELAQVDPAGQEELRVSRLAMDVVSGGADLSRDPPFTETRGGQTWFSLVYFRKESEPYMTVAMPAARGAVVVAEVNLKFIWDLVSQMRFGRAGLAYVVDGQGHLIAHPDISLVLRKSTLADLAQVRTALAAPGSLEATIARNLAGARVVAAHAPIPLLGWSVLVEQPLGEAFAPLMASVGRTGVLMLLGIVLAVAAGVLMARRMVRPIEALEEGAARFGAGDLGHRIDVRTRDVLETLADRFNAMAGALRESYAGLERKVEERTRALSEALEQQTATAEVLRVISSSPTDLTPVFGTILDKAIRLCDAHLGALGLYDPTAGYQHVAQRGGSPAFEQWLFSGPKHYDVSTGVGRMVRDGRPVHIEDITQESAYREGNPARRATADLGGARTFLAVPMLKEGRVAGGIVIYRPEVRPFTDTQVGLVQTFANQAVIAIENARLFQALQERTQELQQSLEEVRGLSEVSRAVGLSLNLREVLGTVVTHSVGLAGADAGGIFEFDPERRRFEVVASHGLSAVFLDTIRGADVDPRGGLIARAAAGGAAVQVEDVQTEAGVLLRAPTLQEGYRAMLAAPIHGGGVTRGLVLFRRTPGAFGERVVALVTTLAAQSRVAIDNARLFHEVEDKSRQLEVADRHKSEFLASMSHELRTPLNAVIGFSEVLLERMFGELNAKQAEYLDDILASGRHLLSLINDILDLSKIEAGRMELDLAPFDLPAALQNALTLVRERAARQGIAVSLQVDPGLGEIVADERKVKQILLNLLSNAIKFTPAGGRIAISAGPADGMIEIAVRDTGTGIAPEHHELIFEEFRQVGGDYAHKREGTGLGLALTRRLVELHGGTIQVKSVLGEGATFTFTLPARR